MDEILGQALVALHKKEEILKQTSVNSRMEIYCRHSPDHTQKVMMKCYEKDGQKIYIGKCDCGSIYYSY